LRNKAREGQKPFDQVLRYYGFERFLYRLSRSAHRDQFVLKGALLMTAWPMGLTRSTSDIDFRAFTDSSPVALSRIIGEILQVAVEPDAMEFDPSTIQAAQIVERERNPGVRVRFWGSLGKARVRLQLDVAFADVITPGPEEVDYPTILDLPGPRLRAYPKETVVAEKLEAIVRLGGVNSRMKDFFDLWQVSVAFAFDGESLKDAIANTFGSRRTPISTPPPSRAEP
jgi:predicted nucleotidyltransferase component of viral defense system